MRLTTLLSVLAACAIAPTNAFSLESLFKQQVLSNNVINVNDDKPASIDTELADFFEKAKSLPVEAKAAWRLIQNTMTKEEIKKQIDKYNNRLGDLTQSAKSRVESQFTKPVKPTLDVDEEQKFEILSNARFADHSLRIKKNNPEKLGLDTVNQYTGFLDVDVLDKHFFYWFFESRNDPKNDPVILWLNGGPGCSSATGLFFELGPSSINSTLHPVYNPYSWNSNASVIFLDQPVGVGYSYTGGSAVTNTDDAGKDVFIFLELFFQKFPQFSKNDFHIAGESYGGHYVPKFASEIINSSDRSFELTSILVGNGITDSLIQLGYYRPMACGEGGYKPVISEEQCAFMEHEYPRCAALVKICYDIPSALTCVPAQLYCSSLSKPYSDTGLNPYDIRVNCTSEDGPLCYKGLEYVDEYLNQEGVKKAVGALNETKFEDCSTNVGLGFFFNGDGVKPFQQYVAELLEHDVPVLLYAGDKDYICNWLGNHAWSDALEYKNHEQFAAESLKPWINYEGKQAGEIKNYDKFTFLRVYDAGHMVPYDQPENALELVNRWISGDYSFGTKK
ncbi:Alpha/Beta hydrolase protein [Scheffersomyces xylosifermentans]|uniref:Alpha/Beta hydrolase protein n=1 Tax=Scheffersomyces xylosifermentans TaxID=1304137 RepID=UPI00315CC786